MTGASQLERALVCDAQVRGRRPAGDAATCLDHVEPGGDMQRPLHDRPAALRMRRSARAGCGVILGLLFFERDDIVVDLDGFERLEEHARARRRGAMDDARDSGPVLGSHDQDVAAVPVGDDLLLEVLAVSGRAEERLQRASQPRAASEASSNVGERGTVASSAISPDGVIFVRTSEISLLNDAAASATVRSEGNAGPSFAMTAREWSMDSR